MKKLIIILVFAAMIGTCLTTTTSIYAHEEKIEEEMEVINAEDIGLKTIEMEDKEDEVIIIEKEEKVEDEVQKNKDEFILENEEEKDDDNNEVEVESPEVPEGLYEGYEEGIYFEPNCFNCELHEFCYQCDKHEIEVEYFYDEEINPNGGWVKTETCIICGHGIYNPVSEEEVQ